jgi:hypothetical protein
LLDLCCNVEQLFSLLGRNMDELFQERLTS